jgi:hypothetical protein
VHYFTPSFPLFFIEKKCAFELVDWNEDGTIDLVTLNSDGDSSVFLGDGDGAFTTAMTNSLKLLPNVNTIRIVDLNNDGKQVRITSF